jgi:carboxypeptidase PM20D1
MKKILALLLILILVLFTVLIVNTFTSTSRQIDAVPLPMPDYDYEEAAYRLGEAIRYQTISLADTAMQNDQAFEEFILFLVNRFPRIHAVIQPEIVNRFSLLYTWPGTDPDLDPWMLTGHYDVVPVEQASAGDWDHDPFGGVVDDGYIWGRGALDNKNNVMAIMEAVEWLLSEGHIPTRTLYFAFGHDEEIGGALGAASIAEMLDAQNVRLAMVLDEGGVIMEGAMPGIVAPIALIGTSEKGYLDLELVARDIGGHSSMPPKITAAGRISRAVARLQDNPLPSTMDAASPMFRYLAPEMDFGQRLVLSNTWLTGPIVRRQLAGNPSTNAMIRTTTAPTMLSGSSKPNVLPAEARAVINFRLLRGDDRESVIDQVTRIIDDEDVEVRPIGPYAAPSPVSETETDIFRLLHRTISGFYPEALVSPYLVMAATDARHYTGLSDQVFRFMPVMLGSEDLARFHGVNERISMQNYARSIAFYRHLIMEMDFRETGVEAGAEQDVDESLL